MAASTDAPFGGAAELERWLIERGLSGAASAVRAPDSAHRTFAAAPSAGVGLTASASAGALGGGSSSGGGSSGNSNGLNSASRMSAKEKERITALLGRYGAESGGRSANGSGGVTASTSAFGGVMGLGASNSGGGVGATPIAYELTTQNGYPTNAQHHITHSSAGGGSGGGRDPTAGADTESVHSFTSAVSHRSAASRASVASSALHRLNSNAVRGGGGGGGLKSSGSSKAVLITTAERTAGGHGHGASKAGGGGGYPGLSQLRSQSRLPSSGAASASVSGSGTTTPNPMRASRSQSPAGLPPAGAGGNAGGKKTLKSNSSMPALRPAPGSSSQSTHATVSPYAQRVGAAVPAVGGRQPAKSTSAAVKPSKLPAPNGKLPPTSAAAAAIAANSSGLNSPHAASDAALGGAAGGGGRFTSLYPSTYWTAGLGSGSGMAPGVHHAALAATAGSDFKMGPDPLRDILAKFESIERSNRSYQPPALAGFSSPPPALSGSGAHRASPLPPAHPNNPSSVTLAPLHPASSSSGSGGGDNTPGAQALEKYKHLFPSSAMHHPLMQSSGSGSGGVGGLPSHSGSSAPAAAMAAAAGSSSSNTGGGGGPKSDSGFGTQMVVFHDVGGAGTDAPGSASGSASRRASVSVSRVSRPSALGRGDAGSRRGSIEAILAAEHARELTREQQLAQHEAQARVERDRERDRATAAATSSAAAVAAANAAFNSATTAAAAAAQHQHGGSSSVSRNSVSRSDVRHSESRTLALSDRSEPNSRPGSAGALTEAAVLGGRAPLPAPHAAEAAPGKPHGSPAGSPAPASASVTASSSSNSGGGGGGNAQSLFPSRALVESLLTLDLVSDKPDAKAEHGIPTSPAAPAGTGSHSPNASAGAAAATGLATKYAVAEHLRNALGDHTLAFAPSTSALNHATYIASYQPASVLPMALPTLSPELLNAGVMPLLNGSAPAPGAAGAGATATATGSGASAGAAAAGAGSSGSSGTGSGNALSTSLSALSVDLLSLHLTAPLPPFTPVQTETYTYAVTTDREHIQTLIEDRRPAPTPSQRSTALLRQFAVAERAAADEQALGAARALTGPHVSTMPNTALGSTLPTGAGIAAAQTAAAAAAAQAAAAAAANRTASVAAAAGLHFDERAHMAAFAAPSASAASAGAGAGAAAGSLAPLLASSTVGLSSAAPGASAVPIVTRPIQPPLSVDAPPPTAATASVTSALGAVPAPTALLIPPSAGAAIGSIPGSPAASIAGGGRSSVNPPLSAAQSALASLNGLSTLQVPGLTVPQPLLSPAHTHAGGLSPGGATVAGSPHPLSGASSGLPLLPAPHATAAALEPLIAKFRAGTISTAEQQYLAQMLLHHQQQQQIQQLLLMHQLGGALPLQQLNASGLAAALGGAPTSHTSAGSSELVEQLKAVLAQHGAGAGAGAVAGPTVGGAAGKPLQHSHSARSLVSSNGDATERGDVVGGMGGRKPPRAAGRTATTAGNAHATLNREDFSSRSNAPPVAGKVAVDHKRAPKSSSAVEALKNAATGTTGAAAAAAAGIPEGGRDSDDEKENALITPAQRKDLFTKCRNNRYHQVEELFASGVSVHTTDKHGNTCLHIACQNGNKRMVKVCLRWGAHINAQNKAGQSPLHYCMAYNYQEVSIYLIGKGGDDSLLNHFGMSCYDGLRPDSKAEAIAALRKHLGPDNVTPDVIAQHLGELSNRSTTSH